ncbi:hypothetical protein [Phytoactinopolyspora mesophila]|uniref:Uncharacterized protein n=1 Tax=Phytoactinopolyspora mesophila TaxID=2650750 RepID=A0A7K3M4U2_9ACTN|nr:hypothetical protein [Phytoactinopolyspora mesophila]NDL58250.1 hypothetical protein [Phytoactinopolyspora mesophila]
MEGTGPAPPDNELEQIIAETESYLTELRAELERRQQAVQTAEIENLEEHLANARVKWDELKDFLEVVLQELKR